MYIIYNLFILLIHKYSSFFIFFCNTLKLCIAVKMPNALFLQTNLLLSTLILKWSE